MWGGGGGGADGSCKLPKVYLQRHSRVRLSCFGDAASQHV